MTDLDQFRADVRQWCSSHIPAGWRQAQTGASGEEFVSFQKAWFQELRGGGYAVPHWPRQWGGGLSTAEQVVLYQELAACDAPRLVLAFVAIHHAAATLLVAGTEDQQRRHLPAILEGEIWCQGFSEPEAGSDLASLRTTARRAGDTYLVNGQKLWASWAREADWCLLLARTDPDAPKRRGISYFLMDMRTPGIDVRLVRQATGESHFCEMFLDNVEIPASQLVGEENAGWQVAQATLSTERGMTMLELAERLGNAGFSRLVQTCRLSRPGGGRLADHPLVADRLAAFETEVTGLRALCRRVVERHETRDASPADASIVKLFYSELLQRMTDFGTEIAGVQAHTELQKPASSSWESGAWVLDFIGSWEWTIPGGTSEIQRTIIGERGLGLPRAGGRLMSTDLAEVHDELRVVARALLGKSGGAPDWQLLADSGWLGLEVIPELGGAGATFAEVAVVLEELGRAAAVSPYLGTAVLGVATLSAAEPTPDRDELLSQVAAATRLVSVALATGDESVSGDVVPFRLERSAGRLRLYGRATFVPDASGADRLLLLARGPDLAPVVVPATAGQVGVEPQAVLDGTRRLAAVRADGLDVDEASLWRFGGDPEAVAAGLADRAALAVACDSVGLSAAMLDATVVYASQRQQFGRPIGSFQAIKHACADMLVHLSLARELVREAAEVLADGAGGTAIAVSMAKSYACSVAVNIVGQAMQLHGGIGYTWESGIHSYLKRATLNRSLFGSPTAHRTRVAQRYA